MKIFVLLSLLLVAVCQAEEDPDVCICRYDSNDDVTYDIVDICSSYRPESATQLLYCECAVKNGDTGVIEHMSNEDAKLFCFGEETDFREKPVEGDSDNLPVDFNVGLKCVDAIGKRFCFHCNVKADDVKAACEMKGFESTVSCDTIHDDLCPPP